MNAPTTIPNLDELIGLFFNDVGQVGTFKQVAAGIMPGYARTLLSHNEHMTVTVEEFHGCPVDVEVLDVHGGDHYARKILLRRQTDRRVVQFGIVRLDFRYVSADVRREIESRHTPLGKVLIEHNVLRQVQLVGLWKITPGEELKRLFGLTDPAWPLHVYGRTALIYCDGEPAVELLEVVTPV